MSNRSFRYTQLALSKTDRFHLRTVESRHSAKELLRKYNRLLLKCRLEFAPSMPAASAAEPAAERN